MNGSSFENTWISFTQRYIVPKLDEIGPVVLEKKILNFVNIFLLFRNYLPLENGGPFIWINLNPLHLRMLCAKFGWNWSSGSGEEDFKFSSMYFCYFLIIPPWKRAGPFIKTKLNPLHPRMLCAKFGWNWSSGSGEKDENVKSLHQRRWQQQTNFHHLFLISPWMAIHLRKKEQILFANIKLFCAMLGPVTLKGYIIFCCQFN